MTAERVMPQLVSHERHQAVGSFASVDRLRRDEEAKFDLSVRRGYAAFVLREGNRCEQDKRRAHRYAQLNPDFESGSCRIRFPVAVKMAFDTAGKMGGNAGSPRPVGE